MTSDFYLSLTPWLAFAVTDRSGGLGPFYASVVAAAVAAVIVANDIRSRRRHRLAAVGLGLFLAQALAAAVLHDPSWMAPDDRPFATSVLSLALLGSAAGVPLTLGYGDDARPRTGTDSRSFRKGHVRVTLWWSAATAAIAASFAVAAVGSGPVTGTVFNWLIPIVVVIAAASHPTPAQPVARDEVGSALDLLDGFLGHPSGRPRPDPARRAPLRLVHASSDDGPVEMRALGGNVPEP